MVLQMVINGRETSLDKIITPKYFHLLEHIYKLPKETIKRINSIMATFLWASLGNAKKIHLVCF